MSKKKLLPILFILVMSFLLITLLNISDKKLLEDYKDYSEEITLEEAKEKDLQLIEDFNRKNELDPKNTVVSFFESYASGDINLAVNKLSVLPPFLRFNDYGYNEIEQAKIDITENQKKALEGYIVKNYLIYDIVRDIDFERTSIKEITRSSTNASFLVDLSYVDVSKNSKGLYELLEMEKKDIDLVSHLDAIKIREQKNIQVYLVNNDDLGWRIDFKSSANDDLISAITGGLDGKGDEYTTRSSM